MHFEPRFPAEKISNGRLVYRANEYSFAVEPAPGNFTSILFNDLNVEVEKDGRVISVWGLCPHPVWQEFAVAPPPANFGDLFFYDEKPLLPGVSLRASKERWPIRFDRNSGWIFLGSDCATEVTVRLLDGVIFGITKHGDLSGIWLRPEKLPV